MACGRAGSRRRRLPVVTAGLAAAVLLSCGGSGGGSPTQPRPSVFGAVGASITRLAIQGYNEIGGTRAWDDEQLVEYGGAAIDVWAAQIGQPQSPLWGIFESMLAAEPGTDQVWWHVLVSFRPGPPPEALSAEDRQDVQDVAAEIRRLVGDQVPIYASPFPEYAESAGCGEISEASFAVSELMVEFAIQHGLAEPGPSLRPITAETNNGPSDPCHQGPAGRQQHGEDLQAFFGG
jgi:hypothetical protein